VRLHCLELISKKMSTNKNAFTRYRILDNCFSNPGKRYQIKNLVQECDKVLLEKYPKSNGISRRQIYDDIAFLESAEGCSVELTKERDGRNVYYRYSDPNYSIFNNPLNKMEMDQLKLAISILSNFEGMPQFDWVQEILRKLRHGKEPDNDQDEKISFDRNQYLKGIEYIGRLYNAIQNNQVLKVSYHPYKEASPTQVIIHPYYLKQYNNRWFLFGYNPEKGKSDWNLALDRIISIKEATEEFHFNLEIDWKEYFEDIIGVTKPENGTVEEIQLHFYGLTGKYVESKPIHGSQKSKWIAHNVLEVKLQLIPNFEFEKLLLSYGEGVKVIKPEGLIRKVKDSLKKSINLYQC
jgi:predicted DNA-binding transcriptional regulator YafY